METSAVVNKKCRQCKQHLMDTVFFYNGKTHTTCFSCSKSRICKTNICNVCGIRAMYNIVGETIGISCSVHREANMVNVVTKKCIVCKIKYPIFNYLGEANALYCKQCSEPTMVDVKNKKCITCKIKRPNFNYMSEKNPLYCKQCSKPNMIDINHPKCINCKIKQPSFNYIGENKRLYCAECALSTMVNIKDKKCIVCKNKRPNFNYLGETNALYCKQCSEPTMVNIKDKKCIVCKIKQPCFNYLGEKIPLYCKQCSQQTMVNVKHNKCIVCKNKRPNFNYLGETNALYCKQCSEPTMVNIKDKKCIVCKIKYPIFNYLGEANALYCKQCSEPTMVDVKNKKCITCKITQSRYGIPGLPPTMCAKHKTANMISKPNIKCKKINCKLPAIYGIKHPIHCETHKNANDINLVETHCGNCGLLDVCIDGLCINTCSNSDKILAEMKRHQKVKELRVLNILKSGYGEPHEYNICVSSKCGGKNSEEKEFGYDFGTHKVYIEVDENQHKSYCELGEINRMKNIYMDDGGIPIVFLRYNPDNYSMNGKKQSTSQQKREIELIKWIQYFEHFENIEGYNLSVKYLFYSDGDNAKLHNIEPYH